MYIFRNAIYNVLYSPFKLRNDTSGVLILHNTAVRSGIPWHIEPGGETVNDVVTRNNLFIGTSGPALRSGALYRRRGAVLVGARGNFATGLGAPGSPNTRFPAQRTDLRLDPGSRAVDAGVVLPNFNDGFTGRAPDLGCCELGQPLPHYGPRP